MKFRARKTRLRLERDFQIALLPADQPKIASDREILAGRRQCSRYLRRRSLPAVFAMQSGGLRLRLDPVSDLVVQ